MLPSSPSAESDPRRVAVPWCEPCSRFTADDAPGDHEACPQCGQPFGAPHGDARAPWHFKLLVAATAGYLALRALQGVQWLLARV